MNFFRSVFSVEPDPDHDEEEHGNSSDQEEPDETAAAASAAAAATMDFFKSVFSTSPDSPEEEDQGGEEGEERTSNQERDQQGGEVQEGEEREGREGSEEEGIPTASWGLKLGGLIKTFASRSETVIKDLEEFGHGLRAETVAIRDVASRALDVGASAAQEKLESMGQVKI